MIQNYIDGKTNIYAVIGDPISHTFSPVIHNTIAKYLAHNMIYVPFHITNEDLGKGIKGAYALGIKGINVTIPHKKAVIEHIVSLDKTAISVGTVNTLHYTDKGYVGYNTDVLGLSRVFKTNKISIKDKTIVILGAGGSSYAAAAMSAIDGAKKIIIVNRNKNNAISVAQHMKQYYNTSLEVLSSDELENSQSVKEAEIIIQTTSAGFSDQAHLSPVSDFSVFASASVALDIIYKPWETVFLKDAKAFGCLCLNGFEMLVYQAMASYEIWHDLRFEDEFIIKMKDELEKYYRGV